MTRQTQRDMHAQRPVRSDFARHGGGGGLNFGKVALLGGGLMVALVGGYLFSTMGGSSGSATPDEIPTIQAEGPVKQRPDQPGGIDIPHQDVAVFQKLDNKNKTASVDTAGVEHLLPEPETPDMKTAAVKTAGPLVAPEKDPVLPAPSPVTSVTREAAQPAQTDKTATKESVEDLPPAITEAAPEAESPAAPTGTFKGEAEKVKEVVKSAAPKAEPAKVEPVKVETPKAEPVKKVEAVKDAKEIKKLVEAAPAKAVETKKAEAESGSLGRLPAEMFTQTDYAPKAAVKEPEALAPAPAKVAALAPAQATAKAGGAKQIQLASYPDQASADKEVKRIAAKYASALGGVSLRVARADLGTKGIYYRVVSSAVPEDKAKAICADITKQKGNCIVVK